MTNTPPPTAPTTPGDLARWFFWVPLRDVLLPERQRLLRTLHKGWRARYLAARSGRGLMVDEFRRCFGDRYSDQGYEKLVRNAYRAAWRVHLEELMPGKCARGGWPHGALSQPSSIFYETNSTIFSW